MAAGRRSPKAPAMDLAKPKRDISHTVDMTNSMSIRVCTPFLLITNPQKRGDASHDLLLLMLSNVQPFTFHLTNFTFQNSVLYTQKSDIHGEFVKKNGKKLTNIQKLIIFATARWGIPLKETIHKNGATPIFIGIL